MSFWELRKKFFEFGCFAIKKRIVKDTVGTFIIENNVKKYKVKK
jgi:hypothetical protein